MINPARIPDFPRMERATLSHQVALHLLDLVLKRELQPGQKLPSERELSAALGVGRPAVREALSALEILGVVVIKRGHEARISHSHPELLVRPFRILAALEGLDIHMLFEIREILEVGIVGLAAERMSEEEVVELQASVEQLRSATGDSSRFMTLDEEFHALIVSGCRNPLISSVMISVGALGHLYRRVISLFPTFNDRVLLDHERIASAIAARDVDESKHAMRAHIQNAAQITGLAEARGLGSLDLGGPPTGNSAAELLDAWAAQGSTEPQVSQGEMQEEVSI